MSSDTAINDQADKGLEKLAPAIEPDEEGFDRFEKRLLSHLTSSKYFHPYTLLIALMTLTLFAIFATSLRPTHVQIQGIENPTQYVVLPLEAQEPLQTSQGSQDYTVTANFSYGWFSQHVVHIVPDDCIQYIRINGTYVNLNTITDSLCPASSGNFTSGFDLDLKSYLQDGENLFQIGLRDNGWPRRICNDYDFTSPLLSMSCLRSFGLRITCSFSDRTFFSLLEILLLEITALLYFFLVKQVKLPKKIVILILLGLLLRLFYLSYTPYIAREYDVVEHMGYIRYVATNWQLPEASPHGEYYQAPLYYIVAAIIYKLAGNASFDPFLILQELSLVYFTILLIFGALLFQRVCKRKWLFITCTALLVFWPTAIMHSVCITNDVMYDMMSVITMYFLIRWFADKESRSFYTASLFLALTILTKLSGLILIGIVICLGILAILRTTTVLVSSGQLKKSCESALNFSSLHQVVWLYLKKLYRAEYMKKILFFITIIILASSLSMYRSIIMKLHNSDYNLIVGNQAPGTPAQLDNSFYNFLYIDVHTFLTDPTTDNNGANAPQEEHFWNFFLKSMLFDSVWQPSSSIEPEVAITMSALLLSLIAFLFIGVFISLRKREPASTLLLLWLTLSLSAAIYYRLTYPFISCEDFRFVFPVIVPFIYFCVAGIGFFMERKFRVIGTLGYLLAFLFILASCFLFIIASQL
jgi:hypothetical protein